MADGAWRAKFVEDDKTTQKELRKFWTKFTAHFITVGDFKDKVPNKEEVRKKWIYIRNRENKKETTKQLKAMAKQQQNEN